MPSDPPLPGVLGVHARLCGPQRAFGGSPMRAAAARIDLPPPADDLPMPLDAALRTRRSHYAFADSPLAPSTLSDLLHWALGVQRRVPPGHVLGMAPAAGGLPSLRVDVAIGHPGGELTAGLYTYEREAHVLHRTSLGEPPLARVLVQPEFAERAPAAVVLSGRLDVVLAKYPPRHYRTLHVDAGIAVQNLYLVATALGLASCAVAGFHDQALGELLRLPEAVVPLMLFPVGHRP